MPATSSGRIVKNLKRKSGTAHQKNHRWESFTTKISKLSSLDPIRRVRRHGIDTDDLAATTSYFKAGVEKWQELNMSEGFVNFTQEILPLCDSLPQILHFEDRVMELLVAYIEKRERESLEPLLELMTDFAHDLGTRFEKHYAKALELVTAIAGTPQDVEVIEWSFTCLAFLFKYLSKLLVPDLRPTYDLMAPLLGKHRQQSHIARFAAEAMSFLVKKAGAPANRESALPTIIQHAKSDLKSVADTRQFVLYYHGLMTLFAEAMKGNGLSVHTSGPAIFRALFLALDEGDLGTQKTTCWDDVICGVLTSMVHHTSPETLKDITEVILEQSNAAILSLAESRSKLDLLRLLLSARTIGVVAGVRKGSRVHDWPALHKKVSEILQVISKNAAVVAELGQDLDLWSPLVLTVSIVLQYTPMDSVIPFISGFMDCLTKEPLAKLFLTFSSLLSQAEPDRFRSIALPYFRRFVVAHWSDKDNEDTLLILLPKMVSSGVLPSRYGKDGFALPQSWQDQMVSKFERLELKPFPEQASPAVNDRSPMTWHDRCLPKYNALLEVLECTVVHPSTNARIAEILLRKLKLALRPSFALAPEEAHFIVGRGFSAYSRMIRGASEVDRALEPLLRAAAPRYARLPNFLEAMLAYVASLKVSPISSSVSSPQVNAVKVEEEVDVLGAALVSNLSTDSHELRLLSLQLLKYLHDGESGQVSDILSTMLLIEQTPLDLQTARSTSMHIRKLANKFAHQPSDSFLRQAIPSFCFGMLTVKFAQIWEDASAALKQISDMKEGEEIVALLTFSWLENPSVAWDGSARNVEPARNNGLTDFECSNLMRLHELATATNTDIVNAQGTMLKSFEEAQSLIQSPPSCARTQAIRVIHAAPYIAQRRSRQLVPMFLSWASKNLDIDQTGDEHGPVLSDWTRKDQKAQLELFSLFTNPKVLYRSEDVYASLLNLLANGDIEIQRSALKAIFTWKNKSIKPYEENLLNLLDEARFKDEIAIMLQGETLVQPEHRDDLMPVLLRLLYGRTISRKGAASGRQGMEARRLTVLRNLSVEDVGAFLDVALGELGSVNLFDGGRIQEAVFEKQIITARKQVGFTNMIEGVLKELGTKVAPFVRKLLGPILYCLINASRQLQTVSDGDEDDSANASQTSLLRVIRQTGLKCLNLLFKNAVEFEWPSYLDAIIQEIVRPRLEKLPIETAQGISGILQLFLTWSASPQAVLYLGHDGQILRTIAECLAPSKSKDEVKLFVLTIINNVVRLASDDATASSLATQVKTEILAKNMDHFLIQIGGVLRSQHDLSKDLLEACVQTVSKLAPFVSTSTQGRNLVDVSVFLLDQPSRRVNPKTKGGLLLILEHFVPLYNLQDNTELKDRVYNTVTSLFGFFKDKASREVLSRVLLVYSQNDPVIGEVADLCLDLNSFAEGRLDEPDYDRRLKAFNVVNTQREAPFTARQWSPLLYNMLYYIRHDEEFGILSSNSSDGICRFIDTARANLSEETSFINMMSDILIPALYSGAREPSEVIRREYIKVMAHLVRSFPGWSAVNDMYGLLAGDDELESSFFNNILAAGKGRQSGALGQLAAAAEKGELSSKNVSHFFIPLIEHFIFDRAEGNDAHNLAAEATTTVGVLSGALEWPQYRAMLRRFIGYVQSKPELVKQIIRLLGRVVDALALASQDQPESDKSLQKKKGTLAATMPNQPKLAEDLTSNILPPLTAYLHDKDESTVSLRVPVAVISVRLLKLLPEEQLRALLPAILTDICQILRSKAQESRDMARDTLTKICVLLGPSCFGFVLKELKSALARGSQRHVLSYTMHSILVSVIPEYAPGDLDYCLKPIVDVIIDDIFGDPGKEKDAEEYVSKMKEVKSSKSHDSMELIARTATLSNLTILLHPIQLLLNEKLNLRMVRKIDELLHRISNGLLKNADAQSRDSLQFCYEVIRDAQNSTQPDSKAKEDKRTKKYLTQRGAKKSGDQGSISSCKYKLVGFAFDVMRSVLKRYENLRTSKNLAHFIPIIGDSIVEGEEEVKIAAFRLLTVIVKVPLKPEKDRTDLYRVAMAEATTSLLASSSTTSDISQAALKLISAILRDAGDPERPAIPHQEKSIDKVLNKLKEDMTEPERRTPIFNFLRAIMDRKIETAGVYDTLEYAREVMVTNDDDETRNLARGAYCQFLREYIQKKELVRLWRKQRDFIRDNLSYKREDGRLSILGVILFLSKSESPKSDSSHDYVEDVAETLFKPLVSVLVGDESAKCKTLAGGVLKEIFAKVKPAQLSTFLTFMRSCIENENFDFKRIGFQTYLLYYEGRKEPSEGDVYMLQKCILDSLEDSESTWPLVSCALKLMEVLCQKLPEPMLFTGTAKLWAAIRPRLADHEDPHRWIRKSAATLISMYLADFARNNDDFKLSLKGSGGLILSAEDIVELTRRVAGMFRIPDLDVDLSNIIVNNLLFLGRVAGSNNLRWRALQQAEADSEDEDVEEEGRTALNYLFGRISYIIRRETSPPRAPGLIPKTAALRLLQSLTQILPTPILLPSLQSILLPLHNLTDTSIPAPYSIDPDFKEVYEALRSTATEIMESLQRQIGTEEYTRALLEVRRGVKERREKRSSKRKIEAVSAPEKYGRDKLKKVERKKERRKERGLEHRDARHAF